MKHFSQAETMQHQLSEFHTTFGHPQDVPYLDDHILALRKRLVKEEANELLEALDEGDQEQVLKELCDLLYVTVGLADTYGWNLNVAFNRVHMSNMSKLDGDGNVVRDEGGKILKSENYQAPDLSDLVYGGKVPKMYLYKKKCLTMRTKSLKWYNEHTLSAFFKSVHNREAFVRLPHYDVVYVRAAIRRDTGVEHTYEDVYNAMKAEGWNKD